jgi:hypothetical protein
MRLAARSTPIAGVLAIAAIAAPAASAQLDLEPGLTAHTPAARPRPEEHRNLAQPAGSPSLHATAQLTTHASPFDWDDAAIGAAGGTAITLMILGGTLTVSRRRSAHQAPTGALSS